MPPSKRKTRKRQAGSQAAAQPNPATSSPNRSTSKRRKINGGRVATRRQSISPEPDPSNFDGDSTDNESSANKELVESVKSYLSIADPAPGVANKYANDRSSMNSAQKINAYATLSGRNWTFYILGTTILIGRESEEHDSVHQNRLESSPATQQTSSPQIDIDLAPSKFVSRHHASIVYEGEIERWQLRVFGRNGVKVNTAIVRKKSQHDLKSGDVLEIAGTQMMFLTMELAEIHQAFIDQAKQMMNAVEEPWLMNSETEPLSHAHPEAQDLTLPTANFQALSSNGQIGQPTLAPAPPQIRRAVTPPPSKKSDPSGSQQSPAYSRGMMMESTQDVDYSLDTAKDLKPPFSYATLIAQAIFSDPEEQRSLSHIYQWIQDKYAFYRHTSTGWQNLQNSIRHNLSLSKAFEKVPRKTNEPGKGMKWRVVPEFRDEQLKKLRGKTAASGPNSPATGNVNPNFRGPNGQPLGYDSSYAGQFQLNESQANRQGQTSSQIPVTNSPPRSSTQAHDTWTPERGGNGLRRTSDGNEDLGFGDSPVPLDSKPRPTFTRPAQSPPTLSSSYLDTPYRNPHSTRTPAPVRQNVQLAPPSTLVAPSKFMPESSPAGPGSFPFYMKGFGSTPAGPPLPEISPLKRDPDDEDHRDLMSSSPPPADSGSPSKKARATPVLTTGSMPNLSSGTTLSSKQREVNGQSTLKPRGQHDGAAGEDDYDNDGGFDLAR
ncbi:MAG: hypothetical protein Q9227_001252 [Pyrenula ochraceoflavens]